MSDAEIEVLVRAIEGGLLDDLLPAWRQVDAENLAAGTRATFEAFTRFEHVLDRRIPIPKWTAHERLADAAADRLRISWGGA